MKRTLMIAAPVCWLLCMCALGFSQPIVQDRCENNRRQIAEYQAELRIVDMVKEDYQLRFLKKMYGDLAAFVYKNELAPEYYTKERRVQAAEFFSFAWDADKDDEMDFQIKLRNKIGQVVDKVTREGIPAQKTRAAWLTQQIDIHNNRLRDLKCGQPASDKPEKIGLCSVGGKWAQSTSGVGGSTWIVADNGTATEDGLGRATGTASLSGTTMRITWTTSNGWAGVYEWVMDKSCSAGRGKLTFSAGSRAGQSADSTVTHSQ